MRTGSFKLLLGPHLAVAEANPLVTGEFLQTHRPARADFVGANSNLRAHAELAAVSEPRRGIPIDGGGIDLIQELFRARLIASNDAIGMGRAIFADVIEGLFDTIHDAH